MNKLFVSATLTAVLAFVAACGGRMEPGIQDSQAAAGYTSDDVEDGIGGEVSAGGSSATAARSTGGASVVASSAGGSPEIITDDFGGNASTGDTSSSTSFATGGSSATNVAGSSSVAATGGSSAMATGGSAGATTQACEHELSVQSAQHNQETVLPGERDVSTLTVRVTALCQDVHIRKMSFQFSALTKDVAGKGPFRSGGVENFTNIRLMNPGNVTYAGPTALVSTTKEEVNLATFVDAITVPAYTTHTFTVKVDVSPDFSSPLKDSQYSVAFYALETEGSPVRLLQGMTESFPRNTFGFPRLDSIGMPTPFFTVALVGKEAPVHISLAPTTPPGRTMSIDEAEGTMIANDERLRVVVTAKDRDTNFKGLIIRRSGTSTAPITSALVGDNVGSETFVETVDNATGTIVAVPNGGVRVIPANTSLTLYVHTTFDVREEDNGKTVSFGVESLSDVFSPVTGDSGFPIRGNTFTFTNIQSFPLN
ncbi:MAG: hypothetical protein KIH65_001325 [Candidatus Uhrbacteria bacterium]|nr:hypothetical protein [Candidatus Uhrbacteria bacterium]